MLTHVLYRLCSPSGKRYYGITKNFEKRMRQHARPVADSPSPLAKAVRKYGWEKFSKEILCEATRDVVVQLERSAITTDNSLAPHGYNLTLGGEGTSGYRHTDAEKRKRSLRVKKWLATLDEHPCNNKGRKLSVAHKSLLGERAKARSAELVAEKVASMHTAGAHAKHKAWFNTAAGIANKTQSGARLKVYRAANKESTIGSVWINDGTSNKRVDKISSEKFLATGWRQGQLRKNSTLKLTQERI